MGTKYKTVRMELERNTPECRSYVEANQLHNGDAEAPLER